MTNNGLDQNPPIIKQDFIPGGDGLCVVVLRVPEVLTTSSATDVFTSYSMLSPVFGFTGVAVAGCWVSRVSLSPVFGFTGVGVKGPPLMGARFHQCWASWVLLPRVSRVMGDAVAGVWFHGCRYRRCWVSRVSLSPVFGFQVLVSRCWVPKESTIVQVNGCRCRFTGARLHRCRFHGDLLI